MKIFRCIATAVLLAVGHAALGPAAQHQFRPVAGCTSRVGRHGARAARSGRQSQLAQPARRHAAEHRRAQRQCRSGETAARTRRRREPRQPRARHSADECGLRRPRPRPRSLLLAAKANVDPVDRMEKTAMVYAAGNGNAACVSALLSAGVPVNQRYANDATALMWAAAYGKNDSVKLLLTRGADVAARDNRGEIRALDRRSRKSTRRPRPCCVRLAAAK